MEFENYKSLKNHLDKSNYIYIIYSEYGCKIGITKSPLDRIEQIKLGLPSQKCFYIGLFIGKTASIHEKKLHNLFKNKRISGEWFILNDNDLEYIEKYLVKRDFKCLIKKSIIWANYLIPSIYIEGKVKIIRDTHHSNIKMEIQVPEILKELVIKPDPDKISKAEFLTSTQISKRLKKLGLNYSPMNIGKYMNKLNFQRKAKRIPGIGPSYGYYVMIKNNVP